MATRHDEDDAAGRNAATEAINQARRDATTARRYLRRRTMESGSVDPSEKVQAAEAAVALYDELKEHREKSALERDWEESGIERLEDALGSQTTIEVQASGRTDNKQRMTAPAMQEVSAQVILDAIDTLCELCDTLGYGAPVESGTHRTKIDNELIKEVEEWQKQNLE